MRVFEPGDAEALHKVLGDPVAMWWHPGPWPTSETESWIGSCMESQLRYGCSLWALVDKASGEVIGDCGSSFATSLATTSSSSVTTSGATTGDKASPLRPPVRRETMHA